MTSYRTRHIPLWKRSREAITFRREAITVLIDAYWLHEVLLKLKLAIPWLFLHHWRCDNRSHRQTSTVSVFLYRSHKSQCFLKLSAYRAQGNSRNTLRFYCNIGCDFESPASDVGHKTQQEMRGRWSAKFSRYEKVEVEKANSFFSANHRHSVNFLLEKVLR